MSLSATWKAWRNDRRRALIAGGLPVHVASRLAATETHHRVRIAEFAGEEAAMRGELVPGRSGGLALAGEWDLIAPERRKAVAEMMAVQATTKH